MKLFIYFNKFAMVFASIFLEFKNILYIIQQTSHMQSCGTMAPPYDQTVFY